MRELSPKIKEVLQKINHKDFYQEHFKALIDEDDGYESFEAFCNNKTFYVDKLLVVMEEYNNFEADNNFYEGIKEHLNNVAKGDGHVLRVIEYFNKEGLTEEGRFFKIITAIISYFDYGGYKEGFNKYIKYRTICRSSGTQPVWEKILINYKLNKSSNSNMMPYLQAMDKVLPIMKIDKDYSYKLKNMCSDILTELNINFKNPKNTMLFIMHLLYNKNILPLWNEKYYINEVEPEKQLNDEISNEGELNTVSVTVRKRSLKLRRKFIEKLNNNDSFYCKVCGFDFKAIYGELGQGYIEIHHKKPLSEYDKKDKESKFMSEAMDDLVALCANCHRMVHRTPKQTLSIEELKKILKKT